MHEHDLRAEDLPYAAPEDGLHELVTGRLVREPLRSVTCGWVTANVMGLVMTFAREHRLGRVYGRTGFVLARDPDTVRAPSVALVSAERLRNGTRRSFYFEGAPDLAVEVLSPGTEPSDVPAKVQDFLSAGSLAVWVIDPSARTLRVHRRDQVPQTLAGADTLDAGPAVPGHRFRVGEIFEPWV